jgi:hypothetical protein
VGGSVLPLYFKVVFVIIALSGKKRSGKDEFYRISKEYIEGTVGIPVLRYAFADEVKRFAKLYFNVDVTEEADKEKIRFVLQGVGQMMREECDKDYWLNIVGREIEASDLRYGVDDYVGFITDTRYANEAEWVESEGHLILRIVRKETEVHDPHPSEMELDNYTFKNVFYNDKSYEEYKDGVIEWLKENVLTSESR